MRGRGAWVLIEKWAYSGPAYHVRNVNEVRLLPMQYALFVIFQSINKSGKFQFLLLCLGWTLEFKQAIIYP
jgi:hypothetical protein